MLPPIDVFVGDLREDRVIMETGLASRLSCIAEPVVLDLGFRLVRVSVSEYDGRSVQFMVERPDGSFGISDCASVSRSLSFVLDVDGLLEGEYNLEVSSPGLNRYLVRVSDFVRWTGSEVKVELREIFENRKRFRGVIVGIDSFGFRLRYIDKAGVTEEPFLPFSLVREARLVFTDDLVGARNAAIEGTSVISTED